MAEGKGLAMIFGEPKGSPELDDGGLSEGYPEGFEDACEAAFDAIRAKDSREFCRSLFEALNAYERAPHEENREGREEIELGEEE